MPFIIRHVYAKFKKIIPKINTNSCKTIHQNYDTLYAVSLYTGEYLLQYSYSYSTKADMELKHCICSHSQAVIIRSLKQKSVAWGRDADSPDPRSSKFTVSKHC